MLCLRCHDVLPHPGSYDHTIALDARTAELLSDEFPLFENDRISCSICHNPHVLDDNFKLRDISLEYLACPGCHDSENLSRAGQ